MFELYGYSTSDFLQKFWRKRPLVIRNGANIFAPKINKTEFLKAVEVIEQNGGGRANRLDKDSVIFCEQISNGNEALKMKAKDNANKLGIWHDCWFDGSYSVTGHGIGCHFDDSDNFVIQQEGHRLWILGSAKEVDDRDRKRRSQMENGSGNFMISEDFAFTILNPGDVLYLPIYFPHWGVSLEESLSLSFAVQSSSAFYDLFPLLRELLRDEKAWWMPMPTHAEDVQSPEFLNKLSQTLADPSLMYRIVNLWMVRNEIKLNNVNDKPISDNFDVSLKFDGISNNHMWNPREGIDQWSELDVTAAYNDLTKDQVNEILKKAFEKTLDDFRLQLAL